MIIPTVSLADSKLGDTARRITRGATSRFKMRDFFLRFRCRSSFLSGWSHRGFARANRSYRALLCAVQANAIAASASQQVPAGRALVRAVNLNDVRFLISELPSIAGPLQLVRRLLWALAHVFDPGQCRRKNSPPFTSVEANEHSSPTGHAGPLAVSEVTPAWAREFK
jgi:hypothetical protein